MRNPNELFKLVKSMKKDGKDVEVGRCMRGSDRKLNFSEPDRGRVWKEHMERFMNEENEWNQNVQADLVEGPVERVSREEVAKALGKMKAGKAARPSEVSVKMIAASGEIGIYVVVELCQSVLDGRGMPDEWTLSFVVPIFKGKGDAMSCGAYREVRLLEHAMKIVEKVLEGRMWHYGDSGRNAIWFYARQRNNTCSLHFKEVTRGVLRQGEVQFSSVYLATTHDYEIQRKRNYYMAREPRRNHERYRTWTPSYLEGYKRDADDLVLTSHTMEGLREKFWKWKEAFESKGLKVNPRKTK